MGDVVVDLEQLEAADPRYRLYRSDATMWVWICYGLAQAVVTMLMAFDVIDTLTTAEVVTAAALIIYVGVNELIVRPGRDRRRRRTPPTPVMQSEQSPEPAGQGSGQSDRL